MRRKHVLSKEKFKMSNEWLSKWDPALMCLHLNSSDSGRRPGTVPQGCAARQFSEAKCPRGEFLSVTHSYPPVRWYYSIWEFLLCFNGREILIGFYKKNKADKRLWGHRRTRFLFCPLCLAGFDFGCTVTCRYTHIPVMFSLYCFVSKFLSSFSKYCDFNYFRHVWSSPAAGSELLVLT